MNWMSAFPFSKVVQQQYESQLPLGGERGRSAFIQQIKTLP